MRAVLVHNINNLLAIHFPNSRNLDRDLAKAAHVSLSTIQRIRAQLVGPSVDTLEAIAAVFKLSAYQLLIPGLDAQNPQVIDGASKDEELLFREWKRSSAVLTH